MHEIKFDIKDRKPSNGSVVWGGVELVTKSFDILQGDDF